MEFLSFKQQAKDEQEQTGKKSSETKDVTKGLPIVEKFTNLSVLDKLVVAVCMVFLLCLVYWLLRKLFRLFSDWCKGSKAHRRGRYGGLQLTESQSDLETDIDEMEDFEKKKLRTHGQYNYGTLDKVRYIADTVSNRRSTSKEDMEDAIEDEWSETDDIIAELSGDSH